MPRGFSHSTRRCPASISLSLKFVGVPSPTYCVFRPIVTDHFGSVTADFGVVTGHFGIVTEAIQ